MVDFFIENWNKLELIYKIIIITGTLIVTGGVINNYIDDAIKMLNNIKKFFQRFFKVNPDTYSNISIGVNLLPLKSDVIKNVSSHKMMIEMDELKIKFQSLNFGDNKRNRIFQIIMYTKINTTIKYLINFVNMHDINNLEKNDFNILIFKMLNEMSNEIDMKLKVELGEDVYNIVIDSPRGMKIWEKQNIESLLKYIKEISNVKYIELNSDVFNLIQSSLSISLMVTFNSMEDRFFNFNGELTEVLEKTHWNK